MRACVSVHHIPDQQALSQARWRPLAHYEITERVSAAAVRIVPRPRVRVQTVAYAADVLACSSSLHCSRSIKMVA